jgi:hypothetical protein
LNTFADGSSLGDGLFPELPIMVEVVEHLNLSGKNRGRPRKPPPVDWNQLSFCQMSITATIL